jgi:hypothetical protein
MLQAGFNTELPVPVIVQVLSLGRNPVPAILMNAPICPKFGVKVIEGPDVT